MANARPQAASAHTPGATHLSATAEIMAFAPGTYAVDMPTPARGAAQASGHRGCARIQPISGGFTSTLAGSDFVLPAGPSAFLRVPGPDPAQILVTIYHAQGADLPELRIRRLPEEPAVNTPVASGSAPGPASIVSVYAQARGDQRASLGAWAGRPGSGDVLEGFAITPAAPLPADAIEYQGSLGAEWDTDWHAAGTFCGTRDVALPLIGLRIRLAGASAAHLRCLYWGSFVGHGERGPFTSGELCASDGAPLEALRVEISGA